MQKDQAYSLRQSIKKTVDSKKEAQILSVFSGKGGVGKSNITLNLAIQLAKQEKRILVIDCDVGMANIDILMGYETKHHIIDVLTKKKQLKDCLQYAPYGFYFIGGGTSLEEAATFTPVQIKDLLEQFQSIVYEFDYILLDFGAGMSNWHLSLLDVSQQLIVVITPEPTSIMDGYASLKIFKNTFHNERTISILLNRVESSEEAAVIYNRVDKACQTFLQINVFYLGFIREDSFVMKAVKAQTPFTLLAGTSKAKQDIDVIVEKILPTEKMRRKESILSRIKKVLF